MAKKKKPRRKRGGQEGRKKIDGIAEKTEMTQNDVSLKSDTNNEKLNESQVDPKETHEEQSRELQMDQESLHVNTSNVNIDNMSGKHMDSKEADTLDNPVNSNMDSHVHSESGLETIQTVPLEGDMNEIENVINNVNEERQENIESIELQPDLKIRKEAKEDTVVFNEKVEYDKILIRDGVEIDVKENIVDVKEDSINFDVDQGIGNNEKHLVYGLDEGVEAILESAEEEKHFSESNLNEAQHEHIDVLDSQSVEINPLQNENSDTLDKESPIFEKMYQDGVDEMSNPEGLEQVIPVQEQQNNDLKIKEHSINMVKETHDDHSDQQLSMEFPKENDPSQSLEDQISTNLSQESIVHNIEVSEFAGKEPDIILEPRNIEVSNKVILNKLTASETELEDTTTKIPEDNAPFDTCYDDLPIPDQGSDIHYSQDGFNHPPSIASQDEGLSNNQDVDPSVGIIEDPSTSDQWTTSEDVSLSSNLNETICHLDNLKTEGPNDSILLSDLQNEDNVHVQTPFEEKIATSVIEIEESKTNDDMESSASKEDLLSQEIHDSTQNEPLTNDDDYSLSMPTESSNLLDTEPDSSPQDSLSDNPDLMPLILSYKEKLTSLKLDLEKRDQLLIQKSKELHNLEVQLNTLSSTTENGFTLTQLEEEFHDRISKLEQRILDLNQESTQLSVAIEESKDTSKLVEKQNQRDILQGIIDSLKPKLISLEQEYQQYVDKTTQQSKDIQSLNEQIKGIERSRMELSLRLKSSFENHNKLETTILDYQNIHKTLTQHKKTLEEEWSAKQPKFLELSAITEPLYHEVSQIKSECDALAIKNQNEIQSFQHGLHEEKQKELKKLEESFNNRILEMQENILKAQDMLQSLKLEHNSKEEDYKNRLAALKSQLDKVTSQNENMAVESTSASAPLLNQKENLEEEYQKKLDSLESSRKNHEVTQQNLIQQLSDMQQKHESMLRTHQSLREDYTIVCSKEEEMIHRIKALETQVKEAERSHIELKDDVTNQNLTVQHLQENLRKSKNLHKSLSEKHSRLVLEGERRRYDLESRKKSHEYKKVILKKSPSSPILSKGSSPSSIYSWFQNPFGLSLFQNSTEESVEASPRPMSVISMKEKIKYLSSYRAELTTALQESKKQLEPLSLQLQSLETIQSETAELEEKYTAALDLLADKSDTITQLQEDMNEWKALYEGQIEALKCQIKQAT